ncbi:MAG: YeeE/YedE family protein [Burkholderiales bacterium]|nr:YeeE/YedE family protein [Burkholderiales bacterium]
MINDRLKRSAPPFHGRHANVQATRRVACGQCHETRQHRQQHAPLQGNRMNMEWTQFTPWASLAGGAVIGLATALFLLANGRVAGIAGIVASPLRALLAGTNFRPEVTRLLFILGLLLSAWLWRFVSPMPMAAVDVGLPSLVLAGLLVGVGVRMGNGCTSGHGVCGLSRFSGRSLVNVLAFMGAGFVTVFVLRHVV